MTDSSKPGPVAHQVAHLLPPNATALEIAAMRAALTELAALPQNASRQLWNADTCPSALLPWLAWALGIEVWDSAWPDAIKRARLREAIPVAKLRGTVGSVRRVLESYGGVFTIREWWQTEPKGKPHTFELTLSLNGTGGEVASARFLNTVIADIERTKPARSHFTVTQASKARAALQVVATARAVMYVRL